MCRLKSAIILKDRVFIPDYDSHSDMLTELGIEDTRQNAETKFIRAELVPYNNDVFSPIDKWEFVVDQDILPDWYVKEYDKQRMVESVKQWAKDRIHIGVDELKISEGKNHYIKDCKDVIICDSASVKYIYGSASVKYIYGSASVENICDSASVENICGSASVKYIYDSASVKYIYGSASVENICGSASVKYIYGSASVENIYGSASVKKISGFACISSSKYNYWKNKKTMIICNNATFRDCYEKVIYQAGDWKLVEAEKEKI